MATWPSYARYGWRDLQEDIGSVVERAEMERGLPKQRRTNSDAIVSAKLTVNFDSKADAAAFETWFFDDIDAGQDFFNWTHPRLGTTLQARIVGGKLGELRFLQPTLETSQRSVTLEYLRQAW